LSIWDDLRWDDASIVAADLETSGHEPAYALQPWRLARGDMWITSASAVRWDPTTGLTPVLSQLFPRRDQIAAFLERAIFNDWTILGWNIAFDISVLMALGPDIRALCFEAKWLDGMLAWRHLDIEPEYEFQTAKHLKKSYSLKGYTDSAGRFFPGAVQEFIPSFAGLDEDVDFHAVDPASLAKLQRYNDRDNVRAWTITKIVWSKLAPSQRRAVLTQAKCLALVAQANLDGLHVDRMTVHHLGAKLDLDAAAMLHELAPDGMTEEIVRSPAKLGELLFDRWSLPVLKTNKSKVEGKADSRSTDKEVLHELAFIDPRAKKIKLYREALNARGKFCESVEESVAYNGDGKTHPVARLFGTYTDRMTVASQQGRGAASVQIGFALHQMKRGKEFREIITVGEDEDMVEFDAAGQEFRWMAIASGDPTMLSLCLPGEDAHSYMGAAIVMTDYRSLMADVHAEKKTAIDNRYLGKFSNLSLQYRTSARKLRSKARVDYDIPLEMPEALRIHATYQRTYPGVPAYWERQIRIVQGLGYVETFGGNRIRVEGDWSGGYGWSMGSTAINARIQGTGADQKHLAIAVITPYLVSIGGRLLFDLHDGLYLAIPSAIRPKAVDVIKQMLDNLPYQQAWGFTPPIPMPWDCKVGKAWGRLKEVKFA
jgi:DNA polymerase I-like protein with 3'-5' exonuclease and polymerase domains